MKHNKGIILGEGLGGKDSMLWLCWEGLAKVFL